MTTILTRWLFVFGTLIGIASGYGAEPVADQEDDSPSIIDLSAEAASPDAAPEDEPPPDALLEGETPTEIAEEEAKIAFLAEDWPAGVKPFGLDSPTLTDEWFGFGPPLRDMGIDIRFFYNLHYMGVYKGGRSTNQDKFSATYDLLGSFDFERMGLIKGGEALVHARQQWGRSVNPYTGARMQVNDDADGDHGIYVDQLWYRQHFFDRLVSLQVGYLDYQTIVDRNAYANSEDIQFMNEALDNNPLFPTASAAGLGATLYVRPVDWYTAIIGAGDAQRFPLYNPTFSSTFHDEDWFLGYFENDFHVKIPSPGGDLLGTYRLGLAYDPNRRPVYVKPGQEARTRVDHYTFYMSHDQKLYRESAEDDQGLGAFFRYAWRRDDSPSDAGHFNQFWSVGLAYTGLVPTRDRDTLGLGFAQLIDSKRYKNRIDSSAGCETIYELYYAIQLTPWLVVTPDIQYIDNPGGTARNDTSYAIAGGVRLRISF